MNAFHKNLKIKETKDKGRGLFSEVPLAAGDIIFEFGGDILTAAQVKERKIDFNNTLQIGLDKYLGLSGDLDDYINHSCNPNCGVRIVGSRALLLTLWEVKPGMELTFDYSTTSSDTKENWTLNCLCGSANCRKEISGYQYLDASLKDFYESRNVVPDYLKRKK